MAGAAALAMLLSGGAVAQAAQPSTAYPAGKPDITALLGEFNNWWTPKKVVTNTADGDAFRGSVTAAGRLVLGYSDDTVVAINNHAAKDTTKVDGTYTQAQRAAFDASDSPANAIASYSTALGDTIGKYLREGLSDGSLPKTNALVFDAASPVATSGFVGTGSAKKDFNYPRPYFTKANQGVDRTIGGDSDLNGLKPELSIIHIPMFSQNGQEFGEDYTDYQEPSQAFPSGHTTKAYNRGIALSTLLPELGPEIMARASEAGNNRVVLGVHYPMDVMGGRIAATAGSSALWSDARFRTNELLPAHTELENYIAARCKADGNGSTVEECVTKLGANADKGYINTFTDVVSTRPVTDRSSAIEAYTSRMTYGFARTSVAKQAPKVPAGAENLLLTAFPDLSAAQRRQVLEASEIDSGYPLDASSQGFERLNLAKAYSANVTLSTDGKTILAINFGNAASKVTTVSSTDTITNLLKDFNRYFVAGVGVTDEGKAVLSHDDKLTESINQAAFGADGKTAQDKRALSDAQMNSTNTLYDALGPVLGAYFKQAANSGKLPKTEQYLKDMNKSASTGKAKAWYQHPRPYVDRVNYVGTTLNMNGTAQTLNIKKVPGYENFDWGDGGLVDNEYDGLYNSGSFPSGHTTFAFTQGTGLASILPELGPQIMTRVSEAGNNRIVLGVHYPLDILGGHIAGQYGVANALSDDATRKEGADARAELVSYLTARCKADGHGDTLQSCIDTTGANDAKGYANTFTDEVSTKPVTDLKSALAAYQARMSYGFDKTGTAGKAPVVPDAAVNLLDNVEAFKALSAGQKKQVLAATEGDSGYPLDATSEGWSRVNLAAAYSAKVTLSADGKNVVKVEPGQTVASVVHEKTPEQPGNNGVDGNAGNNHGQQSTKPGENGTSANGEDDNSQAVDGALASTGASVSAVVVAFVALALIGFTVTVVVRRRRG
jgi:membrane-associated phospholipid phosphatase